jgi:hypothetical protein
MYLWILLEICSFFQLSAVQSSLENDMELLCLTGVEDKLQVYIKFQKGFIYVLPGSQGRYNEY